MKKTMKNALLLATVALLLLAMSGRSAMAFNDESTRATLKELSGVWVWVEDFSDDAKRAGFNQQTFQTDVELKLRLAGIQVLTQQESLATPGSPYLYLNVNALHDQHGEIAAYGTRLHLWQGVRLIREPSITAFASTWSVSGVGYGKLSNVRNAVKDRVDQFINAWLSVNPK